MTIGLPRALLYYRYQHLWNTFFAELGCRTVTSPETSQTILTEGIARSGGECCLPEKLFLGHVHSLIGRCDYILVPRFKTAGKNEEFCVRFWGIPDIVRNSFPEAPLIGYSLQEHIRGNERREFCRMGRFLGYSPARSLRAYRIAAEEQRRQDELAVHRQQELLASCGPKVLIASQPYLIHDAYVGRPLVRMLREQGGIPVFADRCERPLCREGSKAISSDLYWTLNREVIGAISLMKEKVDGALLITAFPCGTDSIVNELVLRRVRDLPITQIVLDEQQGEAGLQTRVECFMDILSERKRAHVQ